MAQHPTEEILNITRKFLGGEIGSPGQPPGGRQLPGQASNVAQGRAFGQQGRRRRQAETPVVPPSAAGRLSDRFLDLPGPVGFAQTPQGKAILQRILSLRGRR